VAGPLAHILILDLSRVLAGPWASMTLADLGAQVIKVEQPGAGDDTRRWGPPFAPPTDGGDGDAAYFLCCNRGKRSVTIDFTRAEGQRLIRGLAAQADVLIENFKVGALARYGLDWPAMRAVNPKLVYCSITGFGQTGPLKDRAGYDFLIQGMSGLMSVTGEPDGVPGGGPMKVGVALSDVITGLYATIGILAALQHAARTGEGQHIDVALFDAQVAALANQALNYLVSGRAPGRLGNAHPNIVPYETVAAADGPFILAVGNDAQFARFAAVVGRPEWAQDPRFATNPARVQNRAVLKSLIAEVLRTRPRDEWLARLDAAGVPCGRVNSIAEAFAEPQATARGLRLDLAYGREGARVPSVANPIRLSATPIAYRQGPPRLGEHTEDVLRDALGLSADEIAALRATGVI
jgi:crotonobetainyl-CoA:carnitine CoA-transferase CaiB-like acyl-CoA transferase